MLTTSGDGRKDAMVRRHLEHCIAFPICNAYGTHPENAVVRAAVKNIIANLEQSFRLDKLSPSVKR